MADWPTISLNPRLMSLLIRVAQEQGRFPVEVVQDALLRYFRELGVDVALGPDIPDIDMPPVRQGYFGPIGESGPPPEVPLAALFQLIDQGQRERGVEPLSEEKALQLASKELHEMRREGGAGRPQKVEQ